jgi:hypothetical protein
MNTTSRVFVVVRGGHVINVDIPRIVDGTHTVVDFDQAEGDREDAERVRTAFDDLDRAYVRENCPELCNLYFGEFV